MHRRRILRRVSIALALAAASLVVWTVVIVPLRLVVREVDVSSAAWPADRGPLRVAIVGDTHTGGPLSGLRQLRRIVDRTNVAAPDIVLLPGDFVYHGLRIGHGPDIADIAAELARLQAPLGVYAVMGNHEHWDDAEAIRAAIEAAGIPVLEDRAVYVEQGDLWVAGVSDLWESRCDLRAALADVPDDATVLLMSHNPDIFPEVPPRVALTVAGHTHGGQIVLPGYGPVMVPSAYGRRYLRGHVEEDGRHLYVTPGVGTSVVPARLGVTPEISFVVLRSAPTPAGPPAPRHTEPTDSASPDAAQETQP